LFSCPSAKWKSPFSAVCFAADGNGRVYFVHVVVSGSSARSDQYVEVPVLSFPVPTTLSLAATLALAQKVTALYLLRSRGTVVTNAPPA